MDEEVALPVNPIDYGRYGHGEMIRVFEEKYRHALWLRSEAAVVSVQAEIGIIPHDAAEDIGKTARPEVVTLERTTTLPRSLRQCPCCSIVPDIV